MIYEFITKEGLSHVGMIIHSTTLNSEDKVKAIYGGTSWVSHTGYMLRGATSGVVANSTTKTGGNDNSIIPYHTHTATTGNDTHTHNVYYQGQTQTSTSSQGNRLSTSTGSKGYYSTALSSNTHNHTVTVNYAGEDTTNKNIPNYKSVYIWERVE